MRPILVIAQVFPPRIGGSGRWLWELYRRLPPGSVHVIAGDTAGAGEFDRALPLPVTRLPLDFANWGLLHWTSARQYLRAFHDTRRIADRWTPRVIHCAKALPEGVVGLWLGRRHRIPFWCYVHGEELTLARTSRELRWMTGQVFARAERVVANSQHTRRLLMEDWSVAPERVTVLHPGVDTTRFVPAGRDEQVRARLGWTDRLVLLTVGALQKRKGQDMLIRALPAIRQRFPSVLYCVAGEGWERDYLRQLARDVGVEASMQFRGVASEAELVQYYQQCDLFVLPNRRVGWDFEGFGIVLLEAQACGKPVVTGLSGGTVETIDPTRSGYAINGATPDALVEAVTRILSDPLTGGAMGAHARQWVTKHFNWDVVALEARALFCRDSVVAAPSV